ncbi:MAG TPA: DMT family transporter [Blastocatellia bacterium]|nr:DMT family transporter [Blastocatellia bacterium]
MSQPNLTTAERVPESQPGPKRSFEGADSLLLLTTLIWGVNYPVVKYALADLIPINFAALRFFFGTIVMVAFMIGTRRNFKVSRSDFLRLCGLGFLANVLYQSLFVYGMKLSTAGDASIMLATAPIFTAIIGRFRRLEFFSSRAIAGLALAFLGIVLLVESKGGGGAARDKVLGDSLLILGAICWASYTVGIKGFSHTYGSIKATSMVMLTGAPMLVVVSIPSLLSQNWTAVRHGSWVGVAYSALFSIAIAYIIWGYGVRRIGPTRTSLYSNIIPIATLALAWPMIGERPRLGQVAGAIVILAGVYLVRRGMAYSPAVSDPVEEETEEESVGLG